MEIEEKLLEVARSYPSHLIDAQLRDVKRVAYNIRLALDGRPPEGITIGDIGGGVGLFTPGCAALGMKALLIDDFRDPVNREGNDEILEVHRHYGVEVLSRDVIADGVADIPQCFDIVTSFDSMEHWHHSPKRLFAEVGGVLLRPGGRFVLGAPNCVNLRKRITVPLGIGKWSPMREWYEEEIFRGHVREPDVGDLRYIARDMGLHNVKITGRNWLGYTSRFKAARLLTPAVDRILQAWPPLCSNIYLTGNTAAS